MGTRQAFLPDSFVMVPPPRVASDARIYAIGDIHGQLDLLVDLLGRICSDGESRRDHRKTQIVFLGDYIDRGEDSKGVLEVMTRLAEMRSPNIIFLRGNHEAAMARFLADPSKGADWLGFGGQQTLASFGIMAPRPRLGRTDLFRARDELAARLPRYEPFFDSLVNSFRSGDVFFCHAGIDPEHGLDAQPGRALHWGHPSSRDETPLPGKRIVHGHYDSATPVSTRGRICVDTGAYYSNCLTAVRLDAGEAFLSTGSGGTVTGRHVTLPALGL